MESAIVESKSIMKSYGGIEGVESVISQNGKGVKLANRRGIESCESLLRILALILTLSSSIILGVNKQTKVVPVQIVDTLPPLGVPVTAKWHHLSAFLYFVVANAIACAYAAVSLVLALGNRGGKANVSRLLIFSLDAVMMGLLFSSNGAAAAIGVMGFEGNSHVRWRKVCDVFDKFCHQAAAALVVSFLGAIVFLSLLILAAKRASSSAIDR